MQVCLEEELWAEGSPVLEITTLSWALYCFSLACVFVFPSHEQCLGLHRLCVQGCSGHHVVLGDRLNPPNSLWSCPGPPRGSRQSSWVCNFPSLPGHLRPWGLLALLSDKKD